jgi:hypothetical protein
MDRQRASWTGSFRNKGFLWAQFIRIGELPLTRDRFPTFSAHRTPKLQQRARERHIALLDVWTTGRSEFQPFDRWIFGEFKS